MKIAIFTDTFLPQVNGVTVGTASLVENLPKHEFLIIAPKPSGKISWKPKNCKLAFVSPWLTLPTYKDYKFCFFLHPKVWNQVREFKPDIVLAQTPFFVGAVGKNFAKKFKIPLIGAYNTLLPDFLMYLPLPLVKNTAFAKNAAWSFGNSFYSKCDLIIAPSNAMLSALKAHGLKAKTRKIPYGINEEFFKAGKKAKKNSRFFKLAFMGRLSFEKNIETVVKAFAVLEKKFPELRLAIIGDGPARRTLEVLAQDLGVKEKTEFAGMLSSKALAERMASCDLFVTASTIETQGISTFEAMAAGLPAIAADYLANPEAVRDGFNGLLFKPFSVEDCAGKIEKILRDKKLYSKLSKNAVKFAEGFKWKKVAREFEKAFKKSAKKSFKY